MFRWAIFFFALAVVAGVLGFTNLTGGSMSFARLLSFVFLGASLVAVVSGVMAGGQAPPSVKARPATRGLGVKSTRLG